MSIYRKIVYGHIFILLYITLAFKSFSLDIYTIQISASKSETEARQIQDSLSIKGFSPVWIRINASSENPHAVCLGMFNTSAQAHSYRIWFIKTEFPDASVIGFIWDGNALPENTFPGEFPLKKSDLSQISPSTEIKLDVEYDKSIPQEAQDLLDDPDLSQLNPEQILMKGQYTTDSLQAIIILQYCMDHYPSFPELKEVKFQLARKNFDAGYKEKAYSILEGLEAESSGAQKAEYRKSRCYFLIKEIRNDEAINAFKEVLCDTDATSEMRLESAFRIAALYYRKKDRPGSYIAYEQIYNLSTVPKIRAFSLMNIIALSMELARSEKGELSDTGFLCRQFLETYKNVPGVLRATVALMEAETCFYQEDYLTAAKKGQKVFEEYQSYKREAYTALYWAARSKYRMKAYKNADEIFEQIQSAPLKPEESFPGLNLKIESLAYRIRCQLGMGNKSGAQVLIQELNTLAPNSKSAQELKLDQ
jgi:tetratricopeptide (TPR) repeat protein